MKAREMRGEDLTRIQNAVRIECGLHTDMFKHEKVSEVKKDFHLDISSLEK